MATPKLRFKEFNEDWSKTTLSDIAEINPPSSSLPDKFIYIDLESVKNGRLLAENSIELKNAPSRAQRLLQKDDVLFQVVRPYQQNNLYFEKEGSYVASTGYAQIRANANSSFLYYILHEENFLNNVINRCTGTSYPAINSKNLSSIEVYTTSLEEQTKIASFLSAVDDWIDRLSQKYELLVKYKKGMMQQIFSQKLRFKADDGSEFEDWKAVRLGNVLKKHDEKSLSNNQFPVLTSSRHGLYFQKDYFSGQDVASADTTGYNVVPFGYFTYRHMSDDLIFKFNINNVCAKGIVSTLYPVFTVCEKKLNSYFLQTVLNEGNEFKRFAIMQKQGGSRTYMYFSKLCEMVITIPCIKEQTKIANFLTAIDQKIDNVTEQIDQANTWKKGLLQQMFV